MKTDLTDRNYMYFAIELNEILDELNINVIYF